jgi:hypothetical protein
VSIIYTPHLKLRIKERKFPYDFPKKIYTSPEAKFFDNLTKSYIAVKTLFYAGKLRKISIAYIFDGLDVKIKTIHPEKESEISNRVKICRWMSYEKKI